MHFMDGLDVLTFNGNLSVLARRVHAWLAGGKLRLYCIAAASERVGGEREALRCACMRRGRFFLFMNCGEKGVVMTGDAGGTSSDEDGILWLLNYIPPLFFFFALIWCF